MSERRFFDDASEGHSDIQTNLHGTRKAKFYGTVERNQYKQNKENVNLINRKKAVREQENQKAKRNTKEGREQERLEQERQFEEEKLRKYIALQEQIQKLEEEKRLAEIESGQAHRNAEISVKLREDRERHRLEETQKNTLAAADRAKKAAATQRELEEQMNGPRRKYLENRDKVMEQEYDRAHKLAAEYRENQKDRSEEREDYTPYEEFNKNISKGVYKKKVVGDFSKSHLHNSIVVSHAGEGQMSAFDAARREEERTTARREEFRASKDDVRMKSLERWQTATKKAKEKQMEKALEDQLQRLQKAKNLQKIEEGKKYPEMQLKPGTKLQIQNRNQKLAEKEFEDMFMGNGAAKRSEGTKGKKTTTRPPFKAPTLAPARPQPLVEQSTILGGFDNTTNRTNEFQEQEHEESEEEEEQPRSSGMKEPSSYREENTRERRQPDSPPKYPDHEEEEEEEPRNSELASSKKYHNESSYSHVSRSGYDQTPEESTMRQDDAAVKRHGLMSFGDRQRQQANAVGKSPELSSYQQESTSQYERGDYLGQSQSSALSDSRYQRNLEDQIQHDKTKQRRAVDNDINNYINEQEAFLQNLENHRKKLNDKLRTTTQENLPNEQPKRTAQPERQAANVTKSSLNSTSKTVAVQEDEAIEDLQKRAESLLSRFMQPAKEEEEHSQEEEEEDSLEYSPAKYGAGLGDTKTTQNNFGDQTQSYAYSQDELEEEKEYSPEKSHHQNRYRANARDDSASELDYSMSDRGERSEKKSKGPAKVDYAVSFGTKQFVPPTETFGKKQNPFEESNSRVVKQAAPAPVKEDKKASWKMDFDMADDQKVAPQTQTRSKPEQRERPSEGTRKQGELIEDQDQSQGPSLAELFQKNRKKMMEKYEQHQKEHHEKPEVKETKPVRTKEEILKQRKAMMEYTAPLSVKAKEQSQAEREARDGINDPFKKSRKSKSKEPKPELLDRLAFGKKATVDKKEMLKLTNKNYELLPEVKKKKEEEKKKEEQRLRRENAKKLDKEIRSKLMK